MSTATLDGPALDLFTQGKNFAVVSLPRQDGTIQSAVVWAHATDDGKVELNSSEGRDWPANLRRAGHATIVVTREGNPYEYVEVTARIAEDTHDGANEHIDFLARKYLGEDEYPWLQEGEQRIIFRLAPERVNYKKG